MTDMLVKLYALPPLEPVLNPLEPVLNQQSAQGISIRRAIAPERHHVLQWVRNHFYEGWVSECEVALSNRPISCWLAVEHGHLIGFGCYDCTPKGFFGPTGVSEAARGKGAGAALLLACLHDMRGLPA